MHQFIQAYLAQHKKLQIAPFGEFYLEEQPLTWQAVDEQLAHQGFELTLQPNNLPTSSSFIAYVSRFTNLSAEEVKMQLTYIGSQPQVTFDSLGITLHKQDNGYHISGALPFNNSLQPVAATKIIRKEQTHNIQVGETQRTNEEMEAFYANDSGKSVRDNWWISALLIGVITLAYAVYYFLVKKGSF
jgi:hypothetical protein